MSRAFVKEDIDIPERITRRRSASGLPPGALNFLTADGAEQLRTRLEEMKFSGADDEAIAEQEEMLTSATIVERPDRPDAAVFGVKVTVRSMTDELHSYRIVGVDELHLEPGNVSWVSQLGKALLGARVGQRLSLPPEKQAWWTVVKIE